MIRLVITDLDNTLYNWVDYFVPSFNAMLQELARLTGLDETALRRSFQRVYRRHRTTEYAFAVQELDLLAKETTGLTVPEVLAKYDPAIQAFRRVRRNSLHLYEGVSSTLRELRRQGRYIAAHTDSMMFYAETRLKQLHIEDLFDALVAPRDHGLPRGTRLEDVRQYSAPEAYTARIPLKRALEPGVVKPNPKCLRDIMSTFGVVPEETAYIGDSLHKDVRMAQLSGAHDIYAAYGKQVEKEHYRQLVEITHWTDEDVARERQLQEETVKPTFTVTSFPELLQVLRMIERE